MFPSKHCLHRPFQFVQQNHINESKVHLNRYGTVVFANTFSKFLSEYYWWGHDNSNKIHLAQNNSKESYLQEPDKENQTRVSNSIENLSGVTFESEESVLLDQSTLSTLVYEPISDSFEKLKNTRLKNPNRLIIAQLNINSLCRKFDSLVQMVHNNLDILLISETKIDSSFSTAQFQIEGYTTYRLDRNFQRWRYTSLYPGRHTIHTAKFWYVYWKFFYWYKYKKKEMAFNLHVQSK